jgi:pimeloyl-ACP methyl ester carboxylesterase
MTDNPKQEFETPYQGWSLKGDLWPAGHSNRALYLHGAGNSSRSGYAIPRGELAQRGIGTTAFDCIGHGDTGGSLADSSVASRTRQAEAVIAARGMRGPIAVLGASMGAYNAVKLTQSQDVASLVLIVPGVYTPEAYEVPFGPEFSNVIRRERSWIDTDAWDILARFRGKLLVIAAEHDAVIPREIPERLVDAAVNAAWRRLHIVKDAEHNWLFTKLKQTPELLQETADLMAQCMETSDEN